MRKEIKSGPAGKGPVKIALTLPGIAWWHGLCELNTNPMLFHYMSLPG